MSATDEDATIEGRHAVTSGRLARIARRLDVPVSAFFQPEGATTRDEATSPTTKGAAELIRLYARLEPEDRTTVLALARRLGRR